MKNVILLFFFSLAALAVTAQSDTASVEKSQWGIQLGLHNVWLSHELRISKEVVLYTDIAANGIISAIQNKFTPQFNIGPRWYYDLSKRAKNEKDISGNSANYVGMNYSYLEPGFVLGDRRVRFGPTHSFRPYWGLKRNITEEFNIEANVGGAFQFTPDSKKSKFRLDPTFDVRVGYRF